MRIACPFCGERGLDEFVYSGDATVHRPANGEMGPFVDYAYLRANPMGVHRELWQHVSGCRSWLVVERDLRDHQIASVALARDLASGRGRIHD